MNEPKKFNKIHRPIKWRTVIGIIIILTAIVFDMPILFGVLYIIWAIQEMVSGYAYILEDVSRKSNPILFWIIIFIWLSCGIYVFTDSLVNNWIKPIDEYNDIKNEYHMTDEEFSRFTEIENGYLYTDEDGDITYYSFGENNDK